MPDEHRLVISRNIDIPSLPAAMTSIISVASSDCATADDLSRAIMLDPALATKVLRMANSAFFGRVSKAETVTQAVVTLGFNSVRTIAVAASVVDNLLPDASVPGFSWRGFWRHCVATGAGAELVSRAINRARTGCETAFVAGLLHDVGKLVIARNVPTEFSTIVAAAIENGGHPIKAEQEIVGTNHAVVGSLLAEEWRIPESIAASIGQHHSKASADTLDHNVVCVRAANAISKAVLGHYLDGCMQDKSVEQIAIRAQIEPLIVEQVIEELPERLTQCDEIMAWGHTLPEDTGASLAA